MNGMELSSVVVRLAWKAGDEITSGHVDFHGYADALFELLGGKIVQSLKTDYSPGTIFNQDHVVAGFFAERLPLGIVEPNAQGVPFAIVVDPQLFHSSFPELIGSRSARDLFLVGVNKIIGVKDRTTDLHEPFVMSLGGRDRRARHGGFGKPCRAFPIQEPEEGRAFRFAW
jgi:hypothetical protein